MTLKARAAGTSSHSATNCNWCNGQYVTNYCNAKVHAYFDEEIGTFNNYESYDTCDFCSELAVYGVDLSCYKCHWYDDEIFYTAEYFICDSKQCENKLYEDISGEHYGGSHFERTVNCQHNKKDAHLTDCTNSSHSSLATVNHYYCTTHGYLGTSSTYPGLTVNPSPSSISFYYGQTRQITPNQQPTNATVTYNSSDNNIATVSSSGLVTAKNKGTAQITVTGVL